MGYVYTITVDRGQDEGTLNYENGTVSVSTTCWWTHIEKVPAKTYHGCSATKMAHKKNSQGQPREGIYLPGAGNGGIFIHMGTGPAWSDGCIVIHEDELLKIWNSITPKDAGNVVVEVRDVP